MASAFLVVVAGMTTLHRPWTRVTRIERATRIEMGGFEQRQAPARTAGGRVSLLFSEGSPNLAASLVDICQSNGESDESLAGVIYRLTNDRVEVVAEGPQHLLDDLTNRARAAAGNAALREVHQVSAWKHGITVEDSITTALAREKQPTDLLFLPHRSSQWVATSRGSRWSTSRCPLQLQKSQCRVALPRWIMSVGIFELRQCLIAVFGS